MAIRSKGNSSDIKFKNIDADTKVAAAPANSLTNAAAQVKDSKVVKGDAKKKIDERQDADTQAQIDKFLANAESEELAQVEEALPIELAQAAPAGGAVATDAAAGAVITGGTTATVTGTAGTIAGISTATVLGTAAAVGVAAAASNGGDDTPPPVSLTLVADMDRDVLVGGAVADTLTTAGFVDVTMTGGSGADIFQVYDYGSAVITDLATGDVVEVDQTSFAQAEVASAFVATADTLIDGRLEVFTNNSGANVNLADATVSPNASILVDGGIGADTIVGSDIGDSLLGNDGNDFINGGAGNDTMNGGNGNDTIVGGGGNEDIINGGAGDDLIVGADANDVVDGGDGNDTLSLSANYDYVDDLNLENVENIVLADTGLSVDLFDQTEGFVVTGGAGNDGIFGGSGNDNISGGAGNDEIVGGAGNDTINGGTGDDSVELNVGGALDFDADQIDLGAELGDEIRVNNIQPFQEVLVTFTSGAVGNGEADNVNLQLQFAGAIGNDYDPEAGATIDDEGVTLSGPVAKFNVIGLDENGMPTQNRGVFDEVILGTQAGEPINPGSILDYYVNGGAGNDTITTGSGRDFLVGGAGDDILDGGSGNDQLLGGAGNDTLISGAGNDTVNGGAGDDLIVGADANDVVNGGDGNDTLSLSADYDYSDDADLTNVENIVLDETGLSLDLSGQSESFVVTGDEGNDTIVSGNGNDTIDSGAGEDLIRDAGVNDVINGGDGTDTLILSANYDYDVTDDELSNVENIVLADTGLSVDLSAQTEGFVVTGGAGNDSIFGGSGNDTISGGNGNDTLNGGEGADSITGGLGNDTVNWNVAETGFELDVAQLGLELNDSIVFNGVASTNEVLVSFVSGAVGNDTINNVNLQLQSAENNGDVDGIVGSTARIDDEGVTLTGAKFNVIGLDSMGNLDALAQNRGVFDLVALGTSGNDTIIPGSPLSTDDYYVNGGAGNDTITTSDGDDFLVGGAGNDNLTGGGGNDKFIGGAGNDILDGGSGNDLLSGGDGNDTIRSGAGQDTINGDGGDDLINGADANDMINGGDGNDTLMLFEDYTGAADNDLVSVENILLENSADIVVNLSNQTEAFVVGGGNGNDFITGGSGNDSISGGDGNDTIDGGTGADQMVGGTGDDVFGADDSFGASGSSEAPTFVNYGLDGNLTIDDIFTFANGVDVVSDFGNGLDKLDAFFVGSVQNVSAFLDLGNSINPTSVLAPGSAYIIYGAFDSESGEFTVAGGFDDDEDMDPDTVDNNDALFFVAGSGETYGTATGYTVLANLLMEIQPGDFV